MTDGRCGSGASRPLSVYVHVPFCVQKCNYCDFCSFPRVTEEKKAAYVAELCRRIRETASGSFQSVPLDPSEYLVRTVYFGGGTPTLLSPDAIGAIIASIGSVFPIDGDAEITAECNPGTVDADDLKHLFQVGVNRLSIGFQSANETELRLLGRIHTAEDFLRCARDAFSAGFRNLSADVMFGIPAQTTESFRETLRVALSADLTHISAYGLKIEEGTPFGRHPERLTLPDEDAEDEMYRDAVRILEENAFLRYEISNFAIPGYHSEHNCAYWTQRDYLGLGVSAHSYICGERLAQSRDFGAFLRGEDITESRETIGRDEAMREYVMLRMRLEEGVNSADFDTRFASLGAFRERYGEKLRRYIPGGFVRETDEGYAFTTKGFRVSNYILSEIL